MKKISALILILALLISTAGVLALSKTKLTYVSILPSPERKAIMTDILSKFEEQNPDIDVEFRGVPWDQAHQKLLTTISAGNPPDIQVAAEVWVPELGAMNGLIDLEPYFEDWEFSDEYLEITKEGMKIYADKALNIPYGYYVRTLFYRKDIFEEQGLEVPETFDEFLEVAKKLTDKEEGVYGMSLRGARGAFYPIPVWGFGALGTNQFFDDDGNWNLAKPEAIEGVEFYADLYREHGVAPEGAINWGFNELISNFNAGVTRMYINDQPTLNTVLDRLGPDKVGTAKVPKGPSGKRYTTLGWMGWVLPKQKNESEEHLQARLKLLKFLATPENVLEWNGRNLLIPTIKDALEKQPDLWGDKTKWLEPTWSMVQDGEIYITAQPYPEMGKFMEQISWQDWQKILAGKATVEETLKEWAQFHEDAYENYLERVGE